MISTTLMLPRFFQEVNLADGSKPMICGNENHEQCWSGHPLVTCKSIELVKDEHDDLWLMVWPCDGYWSREDRDPQMYNWPDAVVRWWPLKENL